MTLEATEEGALIFDVYGAHSGRAPNDADLVAVFVDHGTTGYVPIVHHIHPLGDGIDGGFTGADNLRSCDEGGGRDDGDLDRGRLVADATAALDLQADHTKRTLVPLQADFG